jgi:hypothetical protein
MSERTPVYPQLAGVITLSDVKQKGSGSYAADYVPWAKITQLLNEHANGWLPELQNSEQGGYVHLAPNNTGYIKIQFVHSSGDYTPYWPFAITDNRNNPIPFEKISARDLADSHRRGICSAAAAFFALGYELWARDEVAASNAETVETQPENHLLATFAPEPKAAAKRTKPAPEAKAPAPAAPEATVKKDLIDRCVDLVQAKLDRIDQVAWIADKATKWDLDGPGSKLAQMSIDQLQSCVDELTRKPDLQK